MDYLKYVNKYTGQTRLHRMKFLAQNFPEFQPEGVKILLDELKQTKNWFMYAATCETFGVPQDKQWYETHKQKTKLHITQTDAKINTTRRARGDIQVQSIPSMFLDIAASDLTLCILYKRTQQNRRWCTKKANYFMTLANVKLPLACTSKPLIPQANATKSVGVKHNFHK